MTLLPESTTVSWTVSGIMAITHYSENGPNDASTERFVATEKQAFLEYMGLVWDRNAEIYQLDQG